MRALASVKTRVLTVIDDCAPRELIAASIEADPALAWNVLRAANGHGAGRSTAGVQAAVEALPRGELAAIVEAVPGFDFLSGRQERATSALERMRVHALAVRRVARTLTSLADHAYDEGVVSAAAVLHDIGKLAMPDMGELDRLSSTDRTPEERARLERDRWGFDHAQLGADLARRWALPETLVIAIEHHHDDRPSGLTAAVATADLLAHFAAGARIDIERLACVAAEAGLDRGDLGSLLYDMPEEPPTRRALPCPLSSRELEIVRLLRDGRSGKQIAWDLRLSESTVRSHLQRIYRRLGVADRAQAVLLASENGWI